MVRPVREALRGARGDEAGFTLVEVVVAMVVMLLVMTGLLGVVVSTLTTVAQARQRQAATALATQAMERLRALPYDVVTGGTTSAPPPGDPNIDYASSPARFRPVAVPGLDEVLVVNTVSPGSQTQAVDGVDYTVTTYVSTPSATASAQQPVSVTAVVTWQSAASRAPRTTVQRSTVYSPSGCLSTANRPFSGPCQASFSAQSGLSAAGISVTNPDDSSLPILGMGGLEVELGLPALSTNLLLEQTAAATTSVATTEARAQDAAGATSSSGAVTASAAVDSDPSSPPAQTSTSTTPAQTSTAQTVTGIGGTLRVRPSTTDSGTAQAAVEASPSTCLGADSAGTPLLTGSPTGRPCSSGQVQASGTAGSISYQLVPALGALPLTVASVGPAPVPARAVAAHLTAANSTACVAGTGPGATGCSHSAASRSVGDVLVGAVPALASAPAGFTTSWSVTGLTEQAVAERGTGARASSYTRNGTLRVWNGTGYDAVDLSTVTARQTYVAPAVTAEYVTSIGNVVNVEVSSSVSVAPPERTTSGPADCEAEACFARTSGGGGIRGLTTYVVRVNAVELTRFVAVTDLGGVFAQASYQAAPGA